MLYSLAPSQWPEGWTRSGRQLQRRREAVSLELEALDDREPLVEDGEDGASGLAPADQRGGGSRQR